MTKFTKTTIIVSVMIVAFFALLGWAGRIDFTEQTILSMSQEEYDSIRQKLTADNGSCPSDYEIAKYYDNAHK